MVPGLCQFGCVLSRPAVFSVGIVSGAFGFGEDRDHFEVLGFSGISSHHPRMCDPPT